jgi:hypothetical protein
MSDAVRLHSPSGIDASVSLSDRLNTSWHRPALQLFGAIVLFHWLEHIVQAYQAFVLHWPRQMAMGMLGMWYPWLMKTETLHYGFAVIMLVGLWVLRRGFSGRSYNWWMAAFWLQFWHHIEHLLLFIQAITGRNYFGGSVPTSIGQIWIPRIELHLIYNALVFIPMVVGMYYHMYPPADETPSIACACARHRLRPLHAAA